MPVVELRVDRNLVCRTFSGYKLSFDPVPVLREDLHSTPSRMSPNWHDYSLLHGQLFSRHNHLCADPWVRHNTYFVNARHELMQCIYDPQVGRSLGMRVVYSVEINDHGDGHAQLSGDYNYSMCFVSERFCVLCDGISTYHLLDTGDRSRPSTDEWQLVTRTPVDRDSGKRGFFMYDARLDVVQERKQISLVAGHISRRDEAAHTYMDIIWGHWIFNTFTNEWEYTIRERLETTGALQYCSFEPRAESLIMACNRKIETRKQREADQAAAAEAAAAAAEAAAADPLPTPPPPEGAQNGHAVAFAQDADNADANSDSEDETAGPSGSAGLPIPNLEDPIEECDLGSPDEENQMVRYNLPKGKITHTIFLGNQPLAFVTNLRPGFPPAFATRQGVDASVWLQVYQPSRPDEWSVRHVGQLHALGYVQASKESRKFTACCPEFEYSVICENSRNVLIYHSRHESAEGLRKRNGPQVAVGKQLLITTDTEYGEIMGVSTANNVITVLTEGALMHLQL